MTELLSSIKKPNDVKAIPEEKLPRLAAEIRKEILLTVSKNGGHLASNLGAVELTIALHRFLTFPEDKLIWDVGHQCYTHKLLTGRREAFSTLRKEGGISGFPKREESECDAFDTGHSSTSLSVAAGMAMARDLKGKNNRVVAVIGDGSLSGGMAYEALNNIGRFGTNVIVVLNDNEMSISKNVGGIANYLGHLRMSQGYLNLKSSVERKLNRTNIGGALAKGIKKTKDSIRQIMIPGDFFEEMGLTYFGPVDGHNVAEITMALQAAAKVRGGVLIHVITRKGKGYSYAEAEPSRFHGIEPFKLATGKVREIPETPSYTTVFGREISRLALKRPDIVCVTAAMAGGTGLSEFASDFPGRCFDVGIAEEHAVTFAAGMAASGLRPVVCIYSTFLQRAYDQILHDVCLQKLPVIFAVDRAGIVPHDGETHQGLFDISFLSSMPGMTVLAPSNASELKRMLCYALTVDGPVAIRYPKGSQDSELTYEPEENEGQTACCRGKAAKGKAGDNESRNCIEITGGHCYEIVRGSDVAVSFLGPMKSTVDMAVGLLGEEGIRPTIADARFAAPFDEEWIRGLVGTHKVLVTVEEGVAAGGYGEAVAAWVEEQNLPLRVAVIAAPKGFLAHGSRGELVRRCGLDAEAIADRIRGLL
ncbi:MAG: 1-deoxy-D-xylulose-5-phosphate synthase [Lachnospiraceae bacterium]|nr:1-deoxy-D-xylulose-5-phosphate synthase [Lachnospiraceae bacterium]